MQGYVLSISSEFSCIADRCPSTCCAGWKVVVDDQAYQRYREMPEGSLRNDILSHIQDNGGHYYFLHETDGRCAMLEEDGLCRIQRNLGEHSLCNTCRKYPRLSARRGKNVWISMAASCPVIAEYLLAGEVAWYGLTDDGSLLPIKPEELSVLKEALVLMEAKWETARRNGFLRTDCAERKQKCLTDFTEVALAVLDLLVRFPECRYLEGSFDFYETEAVPNGTGHCAAELSADQEKIWQKLFRQYIIYRVPSRYLAEPQETAAERVRQVLGELLLMRVIAVSRSRMNRLAGERDWIEIVTWSYRFCVHGNQISFAIHKQFLAWEDDLFLGIFPEHLFEQE